MKTLTTFAACLLSLSALGQIKPNSFDTNNEPAARLVVTNIAFGQAQAATNGIVRQAASVTTGVSNQFSPFNPFEKPTIIAGQGASNMQGIFTNNNGTFGMIPGSTTNVFVNLLKTLIFSNNVYLINSSVADASGGQTLDQNIFYLTNVFIPFYGSYPTNGTNIYVIVMNNNDIANGTAGYVGPAVMISRFTNHNALCKAVGIKTMYATIDDNNGASNLVTYASDRNIVNSFLRTNLAFSCDWILDLDKDVTLVSTNMTADGGIVHWNYQRNLRAAAQAGRTLFEVAKTADALGLPDFQTRRLFILPGGVIAQKVSAGGVTNPPLERVLWDGTNLVVTNTLLAQALTYSGGTLALSTPTSLGSGATLFRVGSAGQGYAQLTTWDGFQDQEFEIGFNVTPNVELVANSASAWFGGSTGGGIRLEGATGVIISGLAGGLRIDSLTASNKVVAINMGLATTLSNGLPAQVITVGASPFNWTNTAGYNVHVFVDGVSVTGTTAINGGVVFNSIGQNLLPLGPGEYMTMTYTIGSPTAKWRPMR